MRQDSDEFDDFQRIYIVRSRDTLEMSGTGFPVGFLSYCISFRATDEMSQI